MTAAQIVTPAITFRSDRTPDSFGTAAEARANLGLEAQLMGQTVLRMTKKYYPKDSMLAVTSARAQRVMAGFTAARVQGFQRDAYSQIAVIAGDLSTAQRLIAARLAAPGLSDAERASALQRAVVAFAIAEHPERIVIAEQYMAQLDALGSRAALARHSAHVALVAAYYYLGRSTEVVRHGTAALRLVGAIPYLQRKNAFYGEGSFLYGTVIDALSGQAGGDTVIRNLNTQLLAWTAAPAELLASDSTYRWDVEASRGGMQQLVSMSERIGRHGNALFAHYWVNRTATRDSQSVAVNDGKIRVIELGSFTCGSCMAAVSGLERLHEQYPTVEFNFLTSTIGVWGNRTVESREEADRLAEHFLTVKHITFPIGIALCPRVPTDDGGSQTILTSPMWRADEYPQISKPTIYVLDGRGVIRRVITSYNRDIEKTLAGILDFLQKEAVPRGPIGVSPVVSSGAASVAVSSVAATSSSAVPARNAR
jgi:hypothetical protein